MNSKLIKWLLFVVASMPITAHAVDTFNNFSFDGFLTDSGLPMSSPQNITFKIYSPADCLLYEETVNGVVLDATTGFFSTKVGTGTRGGNDPGLNWPDIFKNSGTLNGFSCTFNPTSIDGRRLRVVAGGQTLGPFNMSSVPMAGMAASLNGMTAPDFLQVNGADNVTQSNIQSIFTGSRYTNLLDLVTGASSLYMKSAPTAAVNMNNQVVGSVASPVAATDAANKNYADSYIGGSAAAPALSALSGGDSGKVMSWNGSQWVAVVPSATDATKLPLAGGTMTGALDMGNQNVLNAGHILQIPQARIKVGGFTNAQESGMGLSTPDAGTFWYNTSTNQLKYWDGGSAQVLLTGGGGITSLNGETAGTQTFSSGTLGTDFNISSSGGVHTFNLPDANVSNRGLLTNTDWATFNAKLGGATAFGGDVSGTYNAISVDKILGRALDPTAPNAGEVLKWNGSNWIPSPDNDSGASAITALTGDVTAAGPGSVAATISNSAVTNAKLAAGAVTDAKVADVGVDKLTNGAGKYFAYQPNSVACANGEFLQWDNSTAHWTCGTPGGGGTVVSVMAGAGLSGGTITSAGTLSIATGGVANANLANNAVDSSKIDDGTVSTADIAVSAVTSAKIFDGSIATADIAVSAVTSFLIADGSIALVDMGNNSVDSARILDGSVTAADLAAGTITTAALANNSVDAAKILDGSVSAMDLAANAVTLSSMANNSVNSSKIDDGSIMLVDLALSAVNSGTIADGSIIAADLANLAVTDAKINDVGVDKITSGGGKYLTYAPNGINCSNGNVLQWTASNRWECFSIPGGGNFMADGSVPMSGGLLGSTGSAAAPGFTFNGDPDVGMYSPLANQLAFSTTGTSRLLIDDIGNVGIGVTNPVVGLDLAGTLKIGDGGEACNAGTSGALRWTGSNVQYCNGSAWGNVGALSAGSVGTAEISNGTIQDVDVSNVGVDKIVSGGGKYFTYQPNGIPCGNAEILVWNTAQTRWECATSSGGDITDVTAGVGLTGGSTSGNATLSVDVGAGANKIPQLDGNSQLLLSAGNAANPTYSFVADSDTGFSLPTSGTIAFNSNGSAILFVDGTGMSANVSGGALVRGLAGAAANPTFAFFNDPNTGMYRPAADQLSFATNGMDRIFLDSNGKVGVGTATPPEMFTVEGVQALREVAAPSGTANYGKLYVKSADSKLYFMDDSGAEFPLGTGGSVTSVATGIGLTGGPITSSGSLSVDVGTVANKIPQLNGSAQLALSNNAAGSPTYSFASDTDVGMFHPATDTLGWATAGAQVMTLDSSGRLGIGTSAPAQPLHVLAPLGVAQIESSTSDNVARLTLAANTISSGMNIGSILFKNTSNGQTNSSITGYSEASTTAGYLTLNTGSGGATSPRMTINSVGNVGVGTTSPLANFDVMANNGWMRLSNASAGANYQQLTVENHGTSGGSSIFVVNTRGTASAPMPTQGNDVLGQIGGGGQGSSMPQYPAFISFKAAQNFTDTFAGTNMEFWTTPNGSASASQRMIIDNAGKVGIGTSAPITSALLDLSSTTAGFLPPRMSSGQESSIGSPVNGLIVYNTTDSTLDIFAGGSWKKIGPAPGQNSVPSGNTADFSSSSTVVLQSVGGNVISLSGIGITSPNVIRIIVADTTSRAYTFSGGPCSTYYYSPANGMTTASTRTVYNINIDYANSTCYVDWKTGYQ